MVSRLIFAHEQGLLPRAAIWDGDKGHLFPFFFSLLHVALFCHSYCTLDATVAHYPPPLEVTCGITKSDGLHLVD